MVLSVRSDLSRPGGGYAILSTDGAELPDELVIEDRAEETFLNEVGQWTRKAAVLPVGRIDPSSVRLGPQIVNAIASDTPLAFRARDGAKLGDLFWPAAIRPSAGTGAGDMLPGRETLGQANKIPDPRLPAPAPPPPPPPLRLTTPAPPPTATAPPVPVTLVTEVGPTGTGRKWALAAFLIALAILAAAIYFGRDSEFEQKLVCNPSGSFYQLTLGGLLAKCHQVPEAPPQPPVDPDEAAYNDFLRCGVGKSGCPARDCAAIYLDLFPHGKHVAEVQRVRDDGARKCTDDDTATREAKVFDDFQVCLRGKAACEQYQCVDQYQGRLTIERYVSSLRQARIDAATACESLRNAEQSFTSFKACIDRGPPCEAGKCDQQFGGALHSGPHAADVQKLLDDARAACSAPPSPSPEQAARDFITKFYRIMSQMGRGSDGSFDDLYGPSVTFKPVGSQASQVNGAQMAEDKRRFFANVLRADLNLQPDSINVDCQAGGQTCRVTGVTESSFTDSQKTRGGRLRVEFLLTDVLTNPRIVYEESKKYP